MEEYVPMMIEQDGLNISVLRSSGSEILGGRPMSRRLSKFRPLIFTAMFVVLVMLVSFILWEWSFTVDFTSKVVQEIVNDRQTMVDDTILYRTQLLNHVNSSTYKLTNIIRPSELLSFSDIEKQVAPSLFKAVSTIPFVSQVFYIGRNEFLYSYNRIENQIIAVFSNTTCSSSNNSMHYWYKMTVNDDTGVPCSPAVNLTDSSVYSLVWIELASHYDNNVVLLAQTLGKKNQSLTIMFGAPLPDLPATKHDYQGMVYFGVSLDSFVDYVFRDLNSGALYLRIGDREAFIQKSGVISLDISKEMVLDSSCRPSNYSSTKSSMIAVKARGKNYQLQCISMSTVGIEIVTVLAFPLSDQSQHVYKMKIAALSLFLVMLIMVAFASCIMLQFTREYQKREVFLNASLIKQKQATQQAERKSMNKSLAFASASHDVRNSLAGITSLIELSRGIVSGRSEMGKNLDGMSICTSKLLDILNSVLDISKVEAGKIHLEEIEFDIAQVIEESVDIFHSVALKKGLEVIWDPCDSSILKNTKVKGDCIKLKQILDNLLGNAIKFTMNGHVSVRAWAKRRRSLQDSTTLSYRRGCQPRHIWGPIGRLFYKGGNDGSFTGLNSTDAVSSSMGNVEFTFEIEDTGIGIPKEKRASVFENYVQVKESAYDGQEGTGLGLGIVQSYVRLMGGEIGILDKKMNEKGTCFKFNIFLKAMESTNSEVLHESPSSRINPSMVKSNDNIVSFNKDFKKDGIHIHALCLVQGEETRRIAKSWLMNLGVKVWDSNSIEQFGLILERLRSILVGHSSGTNTQRVHSESSQSYSDTDGSPQSLSREAFDKKSIVKSPDSIRLVTHILVIVDVSYKPLIDLLSVLKSFSRYVKRHQYKIIWLVDSNTPPQELRMLDNEQPLCDLSLRKPFHGSRLCEVVRILHEFGRLDEQRIQIISEPIKPHSSFAEQGEHSFKGTTKISFNSTNEDKPLYNVNILVVEDTLLQRRVASAFLSQLGSSVTFAENGQRAVSLVEKALEALSFGEHEKQAQDILQHFPYDLILMDCEMPIMNGYEAARQIRAMEKNYGLHIPIIATSAHDHDSNEHRYKYINAGMDFHVEKPLKKDKILNAVKQLIENKKNVSL